MSFLVTNVLNWGHGCVVFFIIADSYGKMGLMGSQRGFGGNQNRNAAVSIAISDPDIKPC